MYKYIHIHKYMYVCYNIRTYAHVWVCSWKLCARAGAKFEELCMDLFKKTLIPVQNVLKDASMAKKQVIYTNIYTYMYYMYTQIYIYIYIYVNVCMNIYIYVYLHIIAYIQIYIYIHTYVFFCLLLKDTSMAQNQVICLYI